MITISPAAAKQVKLSENESKSQGLKLRIAAKVVPEDESIEYGMGFDEQKEDDIVVTSENVDIIIRPPDAELLNGAHMDFVEVTPGQFNFIFLNPNDPNYKSPTEGDASPSDQKS